MLNRESRRYQSMLDRYGLPNDDAEQIREGIKHKMNVDYIHEGQLFCAPVSSHPQKIIDMGTGSGFWAIDSEQLLNHTTAAAALLT